MFNTFKYIFIPAIALVITMKIYTTWVKPAVSPDIPVGEEGKGEVLIGGSFSLTNQDGETVTDKDFLGKYMLVYFGFTNCPMICPTDMNNISLSIAGVGEEMAEKIQPIFITIDPKRDTVENIKPFIANFHPKFQALTGTPEQIASVANAYRVYYKEAQAEDLQEYLMDHTAYIYLMGKDGKYIGHFNHGQDISEIISGLKKFIQ
ncbi:MAG: SCO family protein [Rickettsiales bacterium]|nr:SCO family protein [Pseudomonadota bacterium]MDA0967283.1 SCO family protein [Pseudomonadota bacterium]MDG4544056.1 SCO family protein [Rickettsiales bacterium]MDG4546250.1 SCO family protein [Rickettsiales bacterium]MDG4548380.1 SCO family protein [Rickettsiales bacterium]